MKFCAERGETKQIGHRQERINPIVRLRSRSGTNVLWLHKTRVCEFCMAYKTCSTCADPSSDNSIWLALWDRRERVTTASPRHDPRNGSGPGRRRRRRSHLPLPSATSARSSRLEELERPSKAPSTAAAAVAAAAFSPLSPAALQLPQKLLLPARVTTRARRRAP